MICADIAMPSRSRGNFRPMMSLIEHVLAFLDRWFAQYGAKLS
jgi:hypothetical protein